MKFGAGHSVACSKEVPEVEAMRVCFVTNFIPPYRKTFYEKLCALPGIDAVVVRGRVEGETGRPDYRGPIAAPTVDVRNREHRLGPYTLRYQTGALEAARAHGPQVLVILGMVGNLSNWLLMMWARLTRRRVVIWACGWEPQAPGSAAHGFKQRVMRHYFNQADVCLLYSTKGRNYLQSIGVQRHKLEVCFNGIEIDDLLALEPAIVADAARLREQFSQPGQMVFLYVGGLLADKRVGLLLDAFAGVQAVCPEACLWIVGDGPDAAALKQRAAACAEGSVRFFGRIIEGVDAYFSAADVFVLPGIGGLAFNQAMFWRTPCVATAADGTEDDLVLEGETGFRFDAGQVDSLKAAMLRARALSPQQRTAMGVRARAVVTDRSNVTQMVRVFEATLRRLQAGRTGD